MADALGMGGAGRSRRLHHPDDAVVDLDPAEADKLLGRKPAYQLNPFKPIAGFTADPTVFTWSAPMRPGTR